MTERPILFSGPMVGAIMDGRKTQTRRPVRDQSLISDIAGGGAEPVVWWPRRGDEFTICPYGVPGDRLWVRETWAEFYASSRGDTHEAGIRYAADGRERIIHVEKMRFGGDLRLDGKLAWRPSIHMPRWASRITLEVTDVRVERVQEISCGDLRAEGYDAPKIHPNLQKFRGSWDSIYAKRGFEWDSNPWVWVVTFQKEKR